MKKYVLIMVFCLLALPGLTKADPATGGPMSVTYKTPDYVLDHFPTGHPTITPAMEEVLMVLASRMTVSRMDIELQGWVSEPPCFGECRSANNYARQRQLAKDRAMAVAQWLIRHGVSADRIAIFTVVGRGLEHPTDNYRDQRVDVYLVEPRRGPDPTVNWGTIDFQCPPGYTPQVDKSYTTEGSVVTVNVVAMCVASGPVIIDSRTVDPITRAPDTGYCAAHPHARLCDPTYYYYTVPGLVLGAGGGYYLSQTEIGGGDARDGDREAHGGDVTICEGEAGCIMMGAATGWAFSALMYEVQRSKTYRDAERRVRRYENRR